MTLPSDGLVGVDAEWNDDFHHVIHVATTHEDGGIYEISLTSPMTVSPLARNRFVHQATPLAFIICRKR